MLVSGERGKGCDVGGRFDLGIDRHQQETRLFDRLGKVIASATVEYPMYQERNGWAEQDPLDWWRS